MKEGPWAKTREREREGEGGERKDVRWKRDRIPISLAPALDDLFSFSFFFSG